MLTYTIRDCGSAPSSVSGHRYGPSPARKDRPEGSFLVISTSLNNPAPISVNCIHSTGTAVLMRGLLLQVYTSAESLVFLDNRFTWTSHKKVRQRPPQRMQIL